MTILWVSFIVLGLATALIGVVALGVTGDGGNNPPPPPPPNQLAAPDIQPPSGEYDGAVEVIISSDVEGTTVNYALGGADHFTIGLAPLRLAVLPPLAVEAYLSKPKMLDSKKVIRSYTKKNEPLPPPTPPPPPPPPDRTSRFGVEKLVPSWVIHIAEGPREEFRSRVAANFLATSRAIDNGELTTQQEVQDHIEGANEALLGEDLGPWAIFGEAVELQVFKLALAGKLKTVDDMAQFSWEIWKGLTQ